MRLATPGEPHLTYCTNIHPGESWAEVRRTLERDVPGVKARVSPGQPFGVGLRLSADAAEALAAPAAREELRALLDQHGLYVFTMNGFPYGRFHGTRVKEDVYRPDWTEPERLAYTDRLATLLAELLPVEGEAEGSVSTVPGMYRLRAADREEGAAAAAAMMLRHALTLHRIAERTGRSIVLAIEPEPCCLLETTADTVAFFERHLFAPRGVARFGAAAGLGAGDAEAWLRHHLGVCLDACHMAVEFETPRESLDALRRAGIRIAKLQLSAGLALGPDALGGALDALRAFDDGVYLHQVVERRGTALARFADLADALAALDRRCLPDEWRVHFHVPIFLERLGAFGNTQRYLRELLDIVRVEPVASHLEVETYTWSVLPEEHRGNDVAVAIARELAWVRERLAS